MSYVRAAARLCHGLKASRQYVFAQKASVTTLGSSGSSAKKTTSHTTTSRRDGSTATAAAIPETFGPEAFVPEAWIRPERPRMDDIQPLEPMKPNPVQMSYSFVGMTGGQIFHEMMVRHQVKHICNLTLPMASVSITNILCSRISRWCGKTRSGFEEVVRHSADVLKILPVFDAIYESPVSWANILLWCTAHCSTAHQLRLT
jgi:hypothetical protein